MIDDCNINLTKKHVSAVFHSRVILFAEVYRPIMQIYSALYGDPMFVPLGGAQTWRP